MHSPIGCGIAGRIHCVETHVVQTSDRNRRDALVGRVSSSLLQLTTFAIYFTHFNVTPELPGGQNFGSCQARGTL
jgi:hypothetical protein